MNDTLTVDVYNIYKKEIEGNYVTIRLTGIMPYNYKEHNNSVLMTASHVFLMRTNQSTQINM